MKRFEYEVKELFRQNEIEVPKSALIEKEEDLKGALKKVPGPWVLKPQVLFGARGKAGLIKFVDTEDEAVLKAEELWNAGRGIKKILLEEKIRVKSELYLSITIDPAKASALMIASRHGGMEIESLAEENEANEKAILYENISLERGIMPFNARNLAYEMGLETELIPEFITITESLFEIFKERDAQLLEINPLFITASGELIAGDGKMIIDDSSLYRQKDFHVTRDYFEDDIEYEAFREGIPFLKLDGDIALMCAGAGLTTTVYDLIIDNGGTVSNYLEFGGPNYTRATKAMELCLKSSSKVILIVTFGTIARADVMAEGVVKAINELKPKQPIVTCIRGTNEEAAEMILKKAGLSPLKDTEEAVKTAIKLAKD